VKVVCPGCRTEIDAADLNLDRMLAKCRTCSSVFDFSDQVAGAESAAPLVQRRRPAVPLPPGLTVVEDRAPGEGGEPTYREHPRDRALTIVRRWYTPMLFGLILFCVAWDSFLVFWYSAVGGAPWLFYVFPLLFVAVGAGLTYFTICGFVNRTTIRLADGRLTIQHGPLPWPGNRTIPADELSQLFCEERISRNRNGTSSSFCLSAVYKTGRKVRLLPGLAEPEQGLFIEQRLEERLGIVDVAIAGEYRG
jgi:predicted Zn finger-like uncharacterized protein